MQCWYILYCTLFQCFCRQHFKTNFSSFLYCAIGNITIVMGKAARAKAYSKKRRQMKRKKPQSEVGSDISSIGISPEASSFNSDNPCSEMSMCSEQSSSNAHCYKDPEDRVMAETHPTRTEIDRLEEAAEILAKDKLHIGFMKWKRVCSLQRKIEKWRSMLENGPL